MSDELAFLPEIEPVAITPKPSPVWRVLAVDDDAEFQKSLSFALESMEILGKPIELVQAYSMAQASTMLAHSEEFAVVLVDVVMETDDAGLRLISAVRDILGVTDTRFILLTGQPGMAPVESVMQDYDLSDYLLKSDLGSRGIRTLLTGAVRNYEQLHLVSAAKRGLQLIVESSNRLLGIRNLTDIASAALAELATLIGVSDEGLVCVKRTPLATEELLSPTRSADLKTAAERQIREKGMNWSAQHVHDLDNSDLVDISLREVTTIAASGRYADCVNFSLANLPDPEVRSALEKAMVLQSFLTTERGQVVFFPRSAALADFAIYVSTPRPLDSTELHLLEVFAANISKGFGNVALISKLDRLAYQDDLLGIPNQSALLRKMQALHRLRQAGQYHLVLLDLDDFSSLNTLFGMKFGDKLLESVAERLQKAFPPPCMVARLHSDVFAILGDEKQVSASQAHAVFDYPFTVNRNVYHLSACFSELSMDQPSREIADLLRYAVASLKLAKKEGLGSVKTFDPEIERRATQRYELLQRLHDAIELRKLELHFQPQINLQTGKVVGAEALLRWPTEDGMVPPDTFIPLAEQSSHIHAIGNLVSEMACEAIKRLDYEGYNDLLISLNYSPRQLEQPNILETLRQQCKMAGIAIDRLCLEVTETAMMQSFQQVGQLLERHRMRGGTVAIDDFGTGFSSLEYLLELPADHLKIDKTFVARLESDSHCRSLVMMILSLGKQLGISVVAEGVETEGQANWLTEHGCDIGQGWYFGKAMPLPIFISWLKERG
ncbi:EAL domain-containing protein [Pokkaliibacter sp. CJK22405]|uniref:two-component system response regulator n=1 Tax=Pokkaliibacter sp. CJK22405 TaxID=3384615 RepID=UPI00398517BE